MEGVAMDASTSGGTETPLERLAREALEAVRAGDRSRAADCVRRMVSRALDLQARRDGRTPSGDEGRPVAPRARVACVFRLEGEYWAIGREAAVVRLRDSVGLRHLARLLREPGRDVAALDLVSGQPGAALPPSDAGEILDARARGEYRERIADLREALAEAERCGDPGRADAARHELDVLGAALARAVGLGGRRRYAGSLVERARVNATRTIRAAMRRIGRADPWTGRYLAGTVRTGTYCCYVPQPDVVVLWRL
jgi:hypothetical protein